MSWSCCVSCPRHGMHSTHAGKQAGMVTALPFPGYQWNRVSEASRIPWELWRPQGTNPLCCHLLPYSQAASQWGRGDQGITPGAFPAPSAPVLVPPAGMCLPAAPGWIAPVPASPAAVCPAAPAWHSGEEMKFARVRTQPLMESSHSSLMIRMSCGSGKWTVTMCRVLAERSLCVLEAEAPMKCGGCPRTEH